MKVVSDSSPLIALARIGCLGLLQKLYWRVVIPAEVYAEIVVAGTGLPGAAEIAAADWIEVASVNDRAALEEGKRRTGLGAGEISAILLALETAAALTLASRITGPGNRPASPTILK